MIISKSATMVIIAVLIPILGMGQEICGSWRIVKRSSVSPGREHVEVYADENILRTLILNCDSTYHLTDENHLETGFWNPYNNELLQMIPERFFITHSAAEFQQREWYLRNVRQHIKLLTEDSLIIEEISEDMSEVLRMHRIRK